MPQPPDLVDDALTSLIDIYTSLFLLVSALPTLYLQYLLLRDIVSRLEDNRSGFTNISFKGRFLVITASPAQPQKPDQAPLNPLKESSITGSPDSEGGSGQADASVIVSPSMFRGYDIERDEI